MTAPATDLAKLKALGAMGAEELGETEEDVKIRFVVPLLEALGHRRIRFEHKGKDLLLKDGLPRGCTVVVEVKRPGVSLDAHLAQLERYSLEERSLFSVLTDGRVLRIYAPFWNRARSFAETLLWEFSRADLTRRHHVIALVSVLSCDALVGKWAIAALQQRQATIESVWASAAHTRRQQSERREQLQQRLSEIGQQIADLEAERRLREAELGKIAPTERDRIRALFRRTAVPLVPKGEFGDVLPAEPEPSAPTAKPRAKPRRTRRTPTPRPWTDDDLRKNATPYQARIFKAFVLAGQPTLGLKEIAKATGLEPRVITGAMSNFRFRKELTGREPIIQRHRLSTTERKRRGNLYTISPRCWPRIQRLYSDQPRPTRKRRKKTRSSDLGGA